MDPWQLAGAVVLAGSVIESIRRWIWPGLRDLVRFIDAIPEILRVADKLSDEEATIDTLAEIAHEFKPNDGDSLRDVIDANALVLKEVQRAVELLLVDQEQ